MFLFPNETDISMSLRFSPEICVPLIVQVYPPMSNTTSMSLPFAASSISFDTDLVSDMFTVTVEPAATCLIVFSIFTLSELSTLTSTGFVSIGLFSVLSDVSLSEMTSSVLSPPELAFPTHFPYRLNDLYMP